MIKTIAAKDENMSASSSANRSNEIFQQCMIGVSTRCADLKVAISTNDVEKVEFFALKAVDMWMVGRSACRRFLTHVKPASPYAESARQLLEDRYMALLELFLLATKSIPVPGTVRTLQYLRSRLTSANSEALGA